MIFQRNTPFQEPETLPDDARLSARNGTLNLTFSISEARPTGVLAFLPGQAVFSIEDGRLYGGFASEGNWVYHLMSGPLDLADGKVHHASMVIGHHCIYSQGEDWTDLKLYLDGIPMAGSRFDKAPADTSDAAPQIGSGRSITGVHESFPGTIHSVQLFDEMLTEDAIRQWILKDPVLTPAFFIPGKLPADFPGENFPCELVPALSAFYRKRLPVDRTALNLSPGNILALKSEETTLFLVDTPDFGGILSWYDNQTGRELLAEDNRFFILNCEDKGKKCQLDPCCDLAHTTLTAPPAETKGTYTFTIQSDFRLESGEILRGTMDCNFGQDRLDFTVTVQNSTSSLTIDTCTFPAAKLAAITDSTDIMLAPAMCGVEYSNAAQRNSSYTSWYPRGNASLQLGAYYDESGRGLCCFIEDPIARAKEFEFHAGTTGCELNFIWTPAREGENDDMPNSFAPGCRASMTLIRNGWHETGMKYREMLGNIKALWWNEERTDADNVQWLWENTLWLRLDMEYRELAQLTPDLVKLREYLELPYSLHIYDWYEKGSWLSPMVRPAPHFMEDVRTLQEKGIRSVPYTTARIWQTPDVQGEDVNYSKIALPAGVVEKDGSIATENYGLPCCVLCPATDTYQKWEYEMTVSLAAMGFDGIYADQIGAARPRLCYNKSHGHKAADDQAWFLSGQYPLYKKVRDYWKKYSPDKILTTEDNAEHCVDLFHGLLCWRWMNDGQVPLFTAVYSGKTQFIGLDGVGEEDTAAFAKAATQLTNGEQLGWFQHQKITDPGKTAFRQFIKQLMHLRKGLLRFLNGGIMDTPPVFKEKQQRISLVWGRQGSFRVSSAPVLASTWCDQDTRATILVNWTDEARTVSVALSHRPVIAYMPGSKTSMEPQDEYTLTLAPRSSMVLLDEECHGLDDAFSIINRIAGGEDPFILRADGLPSVPLDCVRGEWITASKQIPIQGANEVIYFGEFDFGNSQWTVEAEFAAPVEHPIGQVELRVQDYSPENLVAVFNVESGFGSTIRNISPTDTFSADIPPVFKGRKKVFFAMGHASHCEFLRWRILKKDA